MSTPYAEVIGDPIAQSKSPLIHGFWLDALGIEGDYRRAHVKPEGLAAYVEERRSDNDWRGCNVTMPHKGAVMDLVDDPGNIRGTIGAMNTIVRQPDGAMGRPTVEDIAAIAAHVRARRAASTPFDLVVDGNTPADDPAAAAAETRRWADAGATWWLEAPWGLPGGVEALRRRIAAGPPRG